MSKENRMSLICLASAIWLAGGAFLRADEPPKIGAEALEIHREGMLFDGHNDLPWQIWQIGGSSFEKMDIAQPQPKLHTDIPRLHQGGLEAVLVRVRSRRDRCHRRCPLENFGANRFGSSDGEEVSRCF